MKKKLYIDIDGVIGDFVSAIFAFYPQANLVNPLEYSLLKMFNNIPSMIIYNSDLYHKHNFKLYPFVQQVLRKLNSENFEIMFVSARPNNVHTQTVATVADLRLIKPVELHDNLTTIPDKLSKIRDDIILNKITDAWVIEDNPQFIMAMAGFYIQYPELKKVLKTFMFAQTYNQTEQALCNMLPEFTTVMSWKHIESRILKNESN